MSRFHRDCRGYLARAASWKREGGSWAFPDRQYLVPVISASGARGLTHDRGVSPGTCRPCKGNRGNGGRRRTTGGREGGREGGAGKRGIPPPKTRDANDDARRETNVGKQTG